MKRNMRRNMKKIVCYIAITAMTASVFMWYRLPVSAEPEFGDEDIEETAEDEITETDAESDTEEKTSEESDTEDETSEESDTEDETSEESDKDDEIDSEKAEEIDSEKAEELLQAGTTGIVFDVTKYGAKPNDSGDDFNAFDTVLKKADETDDVIEVIVPAGTYIVSEPLFVKSHTHIIADKNAIIKCTYPGDMAMLYADSGMNRGKEGYEQFSNIEIEGGTWDRNANDKQIAGVFIFWHGSNVNIHDLTVKNATDHMINVSADKEVTLQNVTFQNHIPYTGTSSDFWGSHSVGDETRYEFVEALHTDFAGSGEPSAFPIDGTVAKNITIDNCTFEATLAGVGSHHNNSTKTENIKVTNCKFNNLKYGAALNAFDFKDLYFAENTVSSPKYGILMNRSAGTVYHNSFSVSGTRAYQKDDSVIKLTNASNGMVEGNTISIDKNIDKGILVEGGTAKILNNTVSNPNKHGIFVSTYANAFTVSGNTISKVKDCAIFIRECTGTNIVDSNIIKESATTAWAGIHVKNSSDNTTVSKNTFECSHSDAAIYYENASGTVTGNIMNSPGQEGIKLKNTQVLANGNIINGATIGIYTLDGGNNRIVGNTVSDSSHTGIRVQGSNGAVVDGNTVTNSKNYGMFVDQSAQCVSVINNKVSGSNEQFGIFLEEDTGKTDFSENFYEKNGYSYDGYNYVAANNVSCGIYAGIFVNKCSAVILGNVVNGCSGDALKTAGSTVQTANFEIKYNTFKTASTGYYDIHLDSGCGVVWVIDNTLGNRGIHPESGVSYITKSDISKGAATVSAVPTQVYTGKAVTPSVTVTKNGKTLTENVDYSVTYANNIECGKATLVITGKGNYTGKQSVYFYICRADSVVFKFTDIKPDAWYVNAVQYASDTGIMAGTGATFSPNANVTRNQVAQILYNKEGKVKPTIENPFSDLKPDHWSYNSVLWAYEKGIANGKPDGTFGVGNNITRLDLAIMLYKYADKKGFDLSTNTSAINNFTDGTKIPAYGTKAMNWAVTQGVMSGKANKTGGMRLDYGGKATRAECASMIMKLLEKNKQ